MTLSSRMTKPPPNLYPTLFEIARKTNEAVEIAFQMAEADPLAKVGEQGRPKYRAFLALLTLCATHNIDLSTPLDDLSAEVERVRRFLEESARLLEGDVDRDVRNFTLAYEVVGYQAHGAAEEGDPIKVQQRLSQMVFDTSFTTHFNRTRQKISTDQKRREILP